LPKLAFEVSVLCAVRAVDTAPVVLLSTCVQVAPPSLVFHTPELLTPAYSTRLPGAEEGSSTSDCAVPIPPLVPWTQFCPPSEEVQRPRLPARYRILLLAGSTMIA
jgi:hypothetical protein